MEPLVTFVVPIYNVASYLGACLDSLRAQTVPDFRAVLVDDGSTCGCAEICDRYAAMDSRFTVIHQENKGRSAARNAGMDACTTKWIWFVDGDDTIPPDSLERLTAALGTDADIVLTGICGGMKAYSTRELTAQNRRDFYLLTVDSVTTDIPAKSLWLTSFLFGSVTYKLFRRAFVTSIGVRFREKLVQSQDRIFLMEAAKRAESMLAVEGSFYCYNKHAGSISYTFTEQVLNRNEAVCMAVREVAKEDIEAIARCDCYAWEAVKVCLRLYFMHPENKKPKGEVRQELKAFLRRPVFQQAFETCDWRLAGPKLWLFARLCRRGWLRIIRVVYKGLFV